MNKYIGAKIGMLTVESVCYKEKTYTCLCDCGNTCKKGIGNLTRTFSCGCSKKIREPLITKVNHADWLGKRNRHLQVIDSVQKSKHIITCRCDCGNIIEIAGSILKHKVSCGCKLSGTVEGMSKTPFYKLWFEMNMRCNNPNNPGYSRYGGRGIKVIWKNFLSFRDDMHKQYKKHVKKHGKSNTSLDRINNDGNYCKENCRRATPLEQGENRSNNIMIDGKTLKQKAIELGIPYSTLYFRHKKKTSNLE